MENPEGYGNNPPAQTQSLKKSTKLSFECNDIDLEVFLRIQKKPLFSNCGQIWSVVSLVSLAVFLPVAFVVSGTLITILIKLMNESNSKGFGASPPILFEHPFSEASFMFLGMYLLLPFHELCFRFDQIRKCCCSKKDNNIKIDTDDKPEINRLWLIVVGITDLIGSTLHFFGLLYTYASVYQMLRATQALFTTIFSILCLRSKRRIVKHPHVWVGIFLILVGDSVVGIYSFLDKDANITNAPHPIVGAILIIIAELFLAIQLVFEEHIVKNYKIRPRQVVGYEGFWGLCIQFFILFALYFSPDGEKSIMGDYGSIESFPAAVVQALNNYQILIFILLFIFNVSIYIYVAIWMTMRFGASVRATVDTLRIVVVWVVQMVRGQQEFSWIQFIGFVLLAFGVLIYNLTTQICGCYGNYLKKLDECGCCKFCSRGEKSSSKEDYSRIQSDEPNETAESEGESIDVEERNIEDDDMNDYS